MPMTERIRDPLHDFIEFNEIEKDIIDTLPFQRLRDINHLGTRHLIYPGATHKRFEHSLGVMQIASKIYDVITDEENLALIDNSEISNRPSDEWKQILRIAALCHDLGHLPFSHAVEDNVFPEELSHENFTQKIIENSEISRILEKNGIDVNKVIKLALGKKELGDDLVFTDWEDMLSKIIIGDIFGADRMDYLLRDSLHTGVVHGEFDLYRLIDKMRILPFGPSRYRMGVKEGGLHVADELLISRYYMYTQVYYHDKGMIFDWHLYNFFKWKFNLEEGETKFYENLDNYLNISDADIKKSMHSAIEGKHPGGVAARRIYKREHYRKVYDLIKLKNKFDSAEQKVKIEGKIDNISKRVDNKFGSDVCEMSLAEQSIEEEFPIYLDDQRIGNSLNRSDMLNKLPRIQFHRIYAKPERKEEVQNFINPENDK